MYIRKWGIRRYIIQKLFPRIPITNHKSSKKKRYAFFSLYINRINAPVNNACVSRYNMNNINIARDQMKSLIDSVS